MEGWESLVKGVAEGVGNREESVTEGTGAGNSYVKCSPGLE